MAAEILIEEREMLEQKSKYKIVSDKEKKVTTINDMTDEGKKMLRKIESEVKVLKRQLEVSAEINRLLQDKNREIADELGKMKVTLSKGITRSNIVCPVASLGSRHWERDGWEQEQGKGCWKSYCYGNNVVSLQVNTAGIMAMNRMDRIVLDPVRTYACTRTARTGVRVTGSQRHYW